VVGIGPGGPEDRTFRCRSAILESSVIVGYTGYLGLIEDLTRGKRLVSTGMTKEVERCEKALELAEGGEIVSLVSSGDPGVYGMAGLALELKREKGYAVQIEVCPGVTAASAAAALLGAPLMLDFAVISLSDLLVPRDIIIERLDAVARADMVVALYNPKSVKRKRLIQEAATIFLRHRKGSTPVGVVTAGGTADQRVHISDLDHFLDLEINMKSVVIVGNSTSSALGGVFLTPRGYEI
jgi:precorrin-3B C17-methyltransferase